LITGVGDKGVDLRRRRRQSRQVERHAAQPGKSVGVRRWPPTFLFQASKYETIRFAQRPRRLFHFGRVRLSQRLKHPQRRVRTLRRLHGLSVTRVVGAHPHPRLEDGNLLVTQLAVRRHLQKVILVADGLQQQTFVGTPRDDGRTAIAASLPAGAMLE
jgi:hypothetical protein